MKSLIVFSIILCIHFAISQEPASLYLGVRDLITGVGIPNITCELYMDINGSVEEWTLIAQTLTSDRGSADGMNLTQEEFVVGNYRVLFYTKAYYESKNLTTFYPYIEIIFEKSNPNEAYTIPVLASPYGYSAYRGSLA